MAKPSSTKVYEFEGFRLDAGHRMLYRENEEVALAPKAVETLLVLVERRGAILTKEELMSAIWTDSIVEESNLAQYLHVLRKTLGNTADGRPFIETLRRRGYRFNGEVSVSEASNGTAAQVPETIDPPGKSLEADSGTAPPRSLRVEKHGNVLALADWREADKDTPHATAPTVDSSVLPVRPLVSGYRRWLFAIGVFAALVAVSSIFWFRPGNTSTLPVRGDVTVLNLTDGSSVDFATISPDGSYFTYASHDGEKAHLWLQQTGQVNAREILKPFKGAIYGTSFSRDSQFIYFVANESRDQPNVLYRVPAFGGVRTKILTDIAAPVSFSPDGSEMTFMRANKETNRFYLVIASSDGERERTLITGKDGEVFFGGGEWSPDGSLIAYGVVDRGQKPAEACSIVGTDPRSGETRSLSPETWDACYRMAWMPDGQGLVFVGTKYKEVLSTRRDQIYYVSTATGESRRITLGGDRHQALSLGVTNKNEVLAVPFNRLSQIWSMDAGGDSRTAQQITKGTADGRGGIAPLADGRVSYITRNGDGFSIWIVNSDGSDRKQLTTDPPAIEELRAVADGRFFVFSARRDDRSHLYRVDADGGSLKQLTFGESREVDSTISPDGKWIVFDSKMISGDPEKTRLWKLSSDGGEPMLLTEADCVTPHYSPDGVYISCVSHDWKRISIVSADNGKTLSSFDAGQNAILNIGAPWTPDGKSLAYIVSRKNVGNIRLQPVDGGASGTLTDFSGGEIYNLAFSTDGTRIYLARGYATRNAVLISGVQ